MVARHGIPDPLDRGRFPADPWRLIETQHRYDDLGVTETLFTVANGYLGMRGNPEEGRDAYAHGTFLNGFHETWPIRHAESAFGFAKTGQTIVNVPDTKVLKLYVDDEPLTMGVADLEHYERSLDFRDGILRRSLIWRTPSGKRVRIDTTRMVSMTQRHLAIVTFDVELLSGDAPMVISSQIINRQDGRDEYTTTQTATGIGTDPRKAAEFDDRVLQPRMNYAEGDRMLLGYQCTNSEMTLAVAADHTIETEAPVETRYSTEDDLAKVVYRIDAEEGHRVRLVKAISYHSSSHVAVRELSDRCDRTLDRVRQSGIEKYEAEQRAWYDEFWANADVVLDQVSEGPVRELQQAIRFNLFSLAQASARADQQGVPAKGVSGSGYEGHYFWDTEVYVTPFLTYTAPELARNTLHFRRRMLPAAQTRAREMAQGGALFPWRTINGEEASAYYAAGTAQVHIDADVAFALVKYVNATGDDAFLVRDGIDMLVETARMWVDLGFWRETAGEESFHIHGVTGPDEYTTVVNNNLFTNVMARFNLEQAVLAVERLRGHHPVELEQLVHRLGLTDDEVEEWDRCAAGMTIPFDSGLGIHPQDDFFLDREVWDLSKTPDELRPLLLHFHPLVIYRFQVLKQADVVLALFMQGDRFTTAEKKADFEYYDPITTGDSTLSAVVQSIVASEVGYQETSLEYFYDALYVDLANSHHNTVDGLHIASCGGVWSALVNGFGGMRDHRGVLSFDPRLPEGWGSLTFPLTWHGCRMRVKVSPDEFRAWIDRVPDQGPYAGLDEVPIEVRGEAYLVTTDDPVVVALDGQGPRLGGLAPDVLIGGVRADGSRITADVPQATYLPETLGAAEIPTARPRSDVPTT